MIRTPLFAVLSLLLLFAGPASAETGSASLLAFELRSLEEPEVHSLSQYRGKPLLMVFFQPECSWCLRQFKTINELSEACDHTFGAIAVGFRGNRSELRSEVRRLRPDFPAYQASPLLLESVGEIDATPLILVGDSTGAFVTWLQGYIPPGQLLTTLSQAGPVQCVDMQGAD